MLKGQAGSSIQDGNEWMRSDLQALYTRDSDRVKLNLTRSGVANVLLNTVSV